MATWLYQLLTIRWLALALIVMKYSCTGLKTYVCPSLPIIFCIRTLNSRSRSQKGKEGGGEHAIESHSELPNFRTRLHRGG